MSKEFLTKLVGELAEVIKFHELETVDSKAAELLELLDHLDEDYQTGDPSMDTWIEEIRQANMVKTTR